MPKVPDIQVFPGGKVVRELENKWTVIAPDGRNVGSYPRRHQAVDKAQHWDKWDAFNSLTEGFSCMAPFSFLLITKSLLTLGGKEPFIPTEEQLVIAMIVDCFLFLGRDYPEIIEKLKERPEILKEIADKVLEAKKE